MRTRISIDYWDDGQVIIWLPHGGVSVFSFEQLNSLLELVHFNPKGLERVARKRPKPVSKIETFEEFLARGGKVQYLPPKKLRQLSEEELNALTLTDIGF